MHKRPAFTLIEVLISIALLGIILPALYQSIDLLRDSNAHLFSYLEKAKKVTKATDTLYLDLLSSDGNISIQKDEYSRVCIDQTKNSLYALSVAKVCWLVLKKDKVLVRVEGNNYILPLGLEERVEVNPIMKNVEIFDVYYEEEKILVLLQQYTKEPISFMIQGISKPEKKKKISITPASKKNNTPKKDTNTTNPLSSPVSNPATPSIT